MATNGPIATDVTATIDLNAFIPQEVASHVGLSRFQELWAGVLCTVVFLGILVQVLYRSKKRQYRLRRVTQKAELAVWTDHRSRSAKLRNEIAEGSLRIFQDNETPYVPYTGRKVPGMIDMSRDPKAPEEVRHSNLNDLLDFREYARFVAVTIRAEIHSLGEEGVVTRVSGELEAHSLRSMLAHVIGALPEQIAFDAEGTFVMSAGEAVKWLCDRYELWRWGLRPGSAYAGLEEVQRFRFLADTLIQHMQSLSPRCALCNAAQKTVKFEPCQHFCSCSSCSVRLTVCPICKAPIVQKIAGAG